MEDNVLFFAALVAAVVTVAAAILGRTDRKRAPATETARRSVGNALMGLQQFIEPSVEYVFQAQNVEQKEEDDDAGTGGDEVAIRSDLAQALARSPVDPEEVRRHLAAAVRLGLDWKALFEQAVADELHLRPFRAPSLPPARRVAPRE